MPKLLFLEHSFWRATPPCLDPDQKKLLENAWKDFVRGGALLPKEGKEGFRAVNSELASLSVKFGDNLLKETNGYQLVLDKREDVAGLSDRVVAGAAEAARKAGLDGKWLFTLQAPSLRPFLQGTDNRELRRQIFTAYITRGDHGNDADNKATLARIAAVRAEKAQLLVFEWQDGTVALRTVPTLAGVTSVSFGDVDRDGKQDLVLTSAEEDTLAWKSGALPLDRFPVPSQGIGEGSDPWACAVRLEGDAVPREWVTA